MWRGEGSRHKWRLTRAAHMFTSQQPFFALPSDEETLTLNMWETPLATASHRVRSIQSYSEQDINCNVNYLQNFLEGSRKVGRERKKSINISYAPTSITNLESLLLLLTPCSLYSCSAPAGVNNLYSYQI